MSAASASPASQLQRVLVWDAPVRVFHWLMVLSFAGAYLTSESETWRLWHVTLGYTMVGLVVFRLVWGVMGTRYARFGAFIRGPRAVRDYLRTMVSGQPDHHVGHNPVGALSILAVLMATLLIGASGWAIYNDYAGEWLAQVHELVANTMMAVVAVHVLGVIVSSRMHNENLARAMVTGHKMGRAEQGIRSAWWSVAAIMAISVAAFWWLQWHSVAL